MKGAQQVVQCCSTQNLLPQLGSAREGTSIDESKANNDLSRGSLLAGNAGKGMRLQATGPEAGGPHTGRIVVQPVHGQTGRNQTRAPLVHLGLPPNQTRAPLVHAGFPRGGSGAGLLEKTAGPEKYPF